MKNTDGLSRNGERFIFGFLYKTTAKYFDEKLTPVLTIMSCYILKRILIFVTSVYFLYVSCPPYGDVQVFLTKIFTTYSHIIFMKL